MSKITLNPVGNLIDATTAATNINNNSNILTNALDRVLFLDGTAPNQMKSTLDMNSNRLINIPDPVSDLDAVNLRTLSGITGNETIQIAAGNNIAITGSAIKTIATTATPTFTSVNVGGTSAVDVAGGAAGRFFTAGSTADSIFGSLGSSSVVFSTNSLERGRIPATTSDWTFGLAGSSAGTLSLSGATSGTTKLKGLAVASGTLTIPSTTDTLVARNTTDTLTNKTLTSPSITTPTGIVKGDVGLGNVDNTSDVNKPVSTAQAAADALKLSLTGGTLSGALNLASDPTATLQAATKQYVDAFSFTGRNPNLIENSGMGLCSVLLPTRVGTAVASSAYASYPGAGSGAVSFTTSGGNAGIAAGKLILVEGATAPHVPHSLVSLTATLNKRLTGSAGTFTGIIVGNWFRLTGGTNTSGRLDYKVIATDGSTFVEIFGGASGSILVNETATYSMTWFAGPAAVDPTVNGYSAATVSFFEAQPGFTLQVAATQTNNVYASLSGWYSSALNSTASILWEVTPGDAGWNSPDACDGFMKTATLRYWRTDGVDWDGTTVTTLPGASYGAKVQKGSAGVEVLYRPMCQKGCSNRDIVNKAILRGYQGKTVSFGMYWKSPSSSTARPFIFDGTTTTYGSFFTSGSFDWKEVTVTLPTTASNFRVGIEITGSVGDTHYGTQPMSIFGNQIGSGNYFPYKGRVWPTNHQHFMRYVGSPAVSLQYVRVEQESNGFLPRDVKSIVCDLEGVSHNPSSIFLMDSVATYIPSLVLITPVAEATCHVPGIQPLGQVGISNPVGEFVSETLVLQPNTVGDWYSMTIDIVGYDF